MIHSVTFNSNRGNAPDFVANVQKFYLTNNIQTVIVPDGATSAIIKAVGAGGGDDNIAGGNGKFISATTLVNPGDTWQIYVGGPGVDGKKQGQGDGWLSGGGGGGSSGITNGANDPLIVAAGGGGGGTTNYGGWQEAQGLVAFGSGSPNGGIAKMDSHCVAGSWAQAGGFGYGYGGNGSKACGFGKEGGGGGGGGYVGGSGSLDRSMTGQGGFSYIKSSLTNQVAGAWNSHGDTNLAGFGSTATQGIVVIYWL